MTPEAETVGDEREQEKEANERELIKNPRMGTCKECGYLVFVGDMAICNRCYNDLKDIIAKQAKTLAEIEKLLAHDD